MLRLLLLGAAALVTPLLVVALAATPSRAQQPPVPVSVAAGSDALPVSPLPRLPRDPAARRAALLAMDTDHDGRWSKAEWLAAGRRAHGFDLMDADNNGYVTPEELRAGFARMREMRDAKAE